MPAFLISLLLKILPYLIGALAVLGAYFGVKRKGTLEERAKWEQKTAAAQAAQDEAVIKAESNDSVVNAKVEQKIEEIKKDEAPKPLEPNALKPGSSIKLEL